MLCPFLISTVTGSSSFLQCLVIPLWRNPLIYKYSKSTGRKHFFLRLFSSRAFHLLYMPLRVYVSARAVLLVALRLRQRLAFARAVLLVAFARSRLHCVSLLRLRRQASGPVRPCGAIPPTRFARGPLPLTEPRAATPSGGLPPSGAFAHESAHFICS